jgi:hypothetical protein
MGGMMMGQQLGSQRHRLLLLMVSDFPGLDGQELAQVVIAGH